MRNEFNKYWNASRVARMVDTTQPAYNITTLESEGVPHDLQMGYYKNYDWCKDRGFKNQYERD